jgi:signal transduction histidine kinase
MVPTGRLRRRLTIAFVLFAVGSAALLAVGSFLLVRQARFDDSLQRAGADARYQLVLAGQFLPLDAERTADLLDSFEGAGRHVLLVADGGTTASNPAFDAVPGPPLRASAAAGQVGYERLAGRTMPHLLLVGGRIPGSTAELYMVHDEDRIHRDLDQLRGALLAGSAVVVVVAALVGGLLVRRTLEPVNRASRAARAVAEGLLDTRLPVEGRDEFGAWAASFNHMVAALSAAQARERRFTADVAHELRTPVTALVAAASLLREHLDELGPSSRRPAELLVADVVRLRHLVDELMEISRLDAGQEVVSAGPVDLVALVTAIVDSRGWHDRVEVLGEPVTVDTDQRRLERVLANLVANAVEHGGREVRAQVTADGTVRVSDRGPGIAAEHLPRLFERFYKADPARGGPGSGLGLAIAWENARLLGARLSVASEPGTGTEFTLRLPVTPQLPDGEVAAKRDPHGGEHPTSEGVPR